MFNIIVSKYEELCLTDVFFIIIINFQMCK